MGLTTGGLLGINTNVAEGLLPPVPSLTSTERTPLLWLLSLRNFNRPASMSAWVKVLGTVGLDSERNPRAASLPLMLPFPSVSSQNVPPLGGLVIV